MSRRHVLDVVYDGPDLDEVATMTALSRERVIELHQRAVYRAQKLGFLPGFAYLGPVSPRLALPRRASPRPRIEPQSVGLAAGFTGVYPLASPGGWHLLGRMVGPPLFDPRRDPPARLALGDEVLFRRCMDEDAWRAAALPPEPARAAPTGPLVVVRVLGLATVQDGIGRRAEESGVPTGGALDGDALAAANRAVGNPPEAAALELARGSITLCPRDRPLLLSANGAAAELIAVGESVTFRAADAPLVIAVAGGISVEILLGSRSTCLPGAFGGFEGRALRTGDALPVGEEVGPRGRAQEVKSLDEVTLSVRPSPPTPGLPAAAWEALLATAFRLGVRSDRVGARLDGGALPTLPGAELPPGKLVRGSVQVTHDGTPVILGPDHPVTGGYPVIGTVSAASLPPLGRLRAGGLVRFRPSA